MANATKVVQLTGPLLEQFLKEAGAAKMPAGLDSLAADLNLMITDSGVTTRVGEAMFIAQIAHESGGFLGDVYEETFTGSMVVFNNDATVGAAFKTIAKQSNRLERYIQPPLLVSEWRLSKKKFDAQERGVPWTPIKFSDYVAGDAQIPYWQKWYDSSSPDTRRAAFARDSMGNTVAGDGKKYIGRGYFQLTGKKMYSAANEALKAKKDTTLPDIVANPEQAATKKVALLIAPFVWKAAGCNAFALVDSPANFQRVTQLINGGQVGATDRAKYYAAAKIALGV